MAEEMLGGFDHTRYRDEVVQRWGREAYESGDRWWSSMSDAEKAGFQQEQVDVGRAYGRARDAGLAPDSPEVAAITARHHRWVSAGWQGREADAETFAGLGQMYVADARFTATYDDPNGPGTAAFIRDAMVAYAAAELA